jgi:hypothetical protein
MDENVTHYRFDGEAGDAGGSETWRLGSEQTSATPRHATPRGACNPCEEDVVGRTALEG